MSESEEVLNKLKKEVTRSIYIDKNKEYEVIYIGKPDIIDPEHFWHTHKMDIFEFYANPENVKSFEEWKKSREVKV